MCDKLKLVNIYVTIRQTKLLNMLRQKVLVSNFPMHQNFPTVYSENKTKQRTINSDNLGTRNTP